MAVLTRLDARFDQSFLETRNLLFVSASKLTPVIETVSLLSRCFSRQSDSCLSVSMLSVSPGQCHDLLDSHNDTVNVLRKGWRRRKWNLKRIGNETQVVCTSGDIDVGQLDASEIGKGRRMMVDGLIAAIGSFEEIEEVLNEGILRMKEWKSNILVIKVNVHLKGKDWKLVHVNLPLEDFKSNAIKNFVDAVANCLSFSNCELDAPVDSNVFTHFLKSSFANGTILINMESEAKILDSIFSSTKVAHIVLPVRVAAITLRPNLSDSEILNRNNPESSPIQSVVEANENFSNLSDHEKSLNHVHVRVTNFSKVELSNSSYLADLKLKEESERYECIIKELQSKLEQQSAEMENSRVRAIELEKSVNNFKSIAESNKSLKEKLADTSSLYVDEHEHLV